MPRSRRRRPPAARYLRPPAPGRAGKQSGHELAGARGLRSISISRSSSRPRNAPASRPAACPRRASPELVLQEHPGVADGSESGLRLRRASRVLRWAAIRGTAAHMLAVASRKSQGTTASNTHASRRAWRAGAAAAADDPAQTGRAPSPEVDRDAEHATALGQRVGLASQHDGHGVPITSNGRSAFPMATSGCPGRSRGARPATGWTLAPSPPCCPRTSCDHAGSGRAAATVGTLCPCGGMAYHCRMDASRRTAGRPDIRRRPAPERPTARPRNASSTAGPRSCHPNDLAKQLECGCTAAAGRCPAARLVPAALSVRPRQAGSLATAPVRVLRRVIVLVLPGPAVTAATPGMPAGGPSHRRQTRRWLHRAIDDSDAACFGRIRIGEIWRHTR